MYTCIIYKLVSIGGAVMSYLNKLTQAGRRTNRGKYMRIVPPTIQQPHLYTYLFRGMFTWMFNCIDIYNKKDNAK